MNKLEEAFESSWYQDCYNGNYKDVAFEVFKAGAEWKSKQSPWISVEDRLPEPHTKVFFIVRYTNHVLYYVGLCQSQMQWAAEDRIFLPNSPLYSVTHWMKIPE